MLIGCKSVFLDVDWLQIGTRDTDWFCVLYVCEVRLWKSLMAKLMVKHEIMVLACQVGLFHLKLTQINSEMNCITKHKCTVSQKLGMGRRGEKFNGTSRIAFCIFALLFVIQEKYQKIWFLLWKKVLLCYYCNAATDRWLTPRHQVLVCNSVQWLCLYCSELLGIHTKLG